MDVFWLRCGRLNAQFRNIPDHLIDEMVDEFKHKNIRDSIIRYIMNHSSPSMSDDYIQETYQAMDRNEYWIQFSEEINLNLSPRERYQEIRPLLDANNCYLRTIRPQDQDFINHSLHLSVSNSSNRD